MADPNRYSDAEIDAYLAKKYTPEPTFFGELGAAIPRAVGQTIYGAGKLASDFGWENNPIEGYGQRLAERNPSGINSLGDIAEHPLAALGTGIGTAAGFIGPQALVRGGGLALAARGMPALGGAMAGTTGQLGLAALPSYGSIADMQGEDRGLGDKLVTGLGALSVGALENMLGVQKALGFGKGMARTTAQQAEREAIANFGATPWRTAGKEFLGSALGEGGEELLQNPIEQLAGYRNPLTAQNLEDTAFGGVLGALGGGAFGAAHGAYRGKQHADLASYYQGLGYVPEGVTAPADLLAAHDNRMNPLDLGDPAHQGAPDFDPGIPTAPGPQGGGQEASLEDALSGPQAPSVLALPHYVEDPYIVFPDGTTGRKSEVAQLGASPAQFGPTPQAPLDLVGGGMSESAVANQQAFDSYRGYAPGTQADPESLGRVLQQYGFATSEANNLAAQQAALSAQYARPKQTNAYRTLSGEQQAMQQLAGDLETYAQQQHGTGLQGQSMAMADEPTGAQLPLPGMAQGTPVEVPPTVAGTSARGAAVELRFAPTEDGSLKATLVTARADGSVYHSPPKTFPANTPVEQIRTTMLPKSFKETPAAQPTQGAQPNVAQAAQAVQNQPQEATPPSEVAEGPGAVAAAATVSPVNARTGLPYKPTDKVTVGAVKRSLRRMIELDEDADPDVASYGVDENAWAEGDEGQAILLGDVAQQFNMLHAALKERDRLVRGMASGKAVDMAALKEHTAAAIQLTGMIESAVGANVLQEAQGGDKAQNARQTSPAARFSQFYRALNAKEISADNPVPTAPSSSSIRERRELRDFTDSKLSSLYEDGLKKAKAAEGEDTHYTGVDAIIMNLRLNSGNPFAARIASRLHYMLQDARKDPEFAEPEMAFYSAEGRYVKGSTGKSTVIDKNQPFSPPKPDGTRSPGVEAYFDGATNTIHIGPNGHNAEIVLHEMLHALVSGYIDKHPTAASVKALDTLRKHVAANMKGQRFDPNLATIRAAIVGPNGLHEFLSYGLTNKGFQEHMRGITSRPYAGEGFFKDAWNSFVAAISRILHLSKADKNVLMDFLYASGELLPDNPSRLDKDRAEGTSADPAFYEPPSPGVKRAGAPEAKTLFAQTVSSTPTDPQTEAGARAQGRSEEVSLREHAQKKPWLKFLFDMMGYKPEHYQALYEKVDEGKQWIRDVAPTLAGKLSWFDASFNIPMVLRNALESGKRTKGVPINLANRFIQYTTALSLADKQLAFAYLDDPETVAGRLPQHVREAADELRAEFEALVNSLPDESEEHASLKRYLQGARVSEALVYVLETGTTGSSSFGVSRLELLKGKVRHNINRDNIVTDESADGVRDMRGKFFMRGKLNSTGIAEYGMISESELARQEAAGIAYAEWGPVDRDVPFTYTGEQGVDGDTISFQFVGNKDIRKMLETDEPHVAQALLNTISILAHAASATQIADQLASMGGDKVLKLNGKNMQTVYADKASLLADLGKVDVRLLDWGNTAERAKHMQTIYRSPSGWVQVPDTPTFGALRGQIVHGPAWMAIQDAYDRSMLLNSAMINDTMRLFKKVKTVYNLPTHVTNMLTNVTLMYLHNIQFRTLKKAGSLYWKHFFKPEALTPAERKILRAFDRSGAQLGDYTANEVKVLLFRSIAQTVEGKATGFAGLFQGVLKQQNQLVQDAAEYAKKKGLKADSVMTELYATGDNVFRLAAFMTTVGDLQTKNDSEKGGATFDEIVEEAGHKAKEQFLDYDIDSRAVQLARQSVLPFFSWTYAIIPVLTKIMIEQPWKVASLAAAYTLVGSMLSAAGDDDDDEETRKRHGKDERLFGAFGPYTHFRMPLLDSAGKTGYINVGKYIPVPISFREQPAGAFGVKTWPAGFTPSGPFMAFAAAAYGIDPYTGRKLDDATDTNLEAGLKRLQYMWQQMTPGGVIGSVLPGTKPQLLPGKDVAGQPIDPFMNALKLAGAPLSQVDERAAAVSARYERQRSDRDFGAAQAKIKRERVRGNLSAEDYAQRRRELQQRRIDRRNEMRGIE